MVSKNAVLSPRDSSGKVHDAIVESDAESCSSTPNNPKYNQSIVTNDASMSIAASHQGKVKPGYGGHSFTSDTLALANMTSSSKTGRVPFVPYE